MLTFLVLNHEVQLRVLSVNGECSTAAEHQRLGLLERRRV